MPVAVRAIVLVTALACVACNRQPQPPPVNASNAASGIDVETLPADESDAIPTNQLDNGVDAPDGNNLNNSDGD